MVSVIEQNLVKWNIVIHCFKIKLCFSECDTKIAVAQFTNELDRLLFVKFRNWNQSWRLRDQVQEVKLANVFIVRILTSTSTGSQGGQLVQGWSRRRPTRPITATYPLSPTSPSPSTPSNGTMRQRSRSSSCWSLTRSGTVCSRWSRSLCRTDNQRSCLRWFWTITGSSFTTTAPVLNVNIVSVDQPSPMTSRRVTFVVVLRTRMLSFNLRYKIVFGRKTFQNIKVFSGTLICNVFFSEKKYSKLVALSLERSNKNIYVPSQAIISIYFFIIPYTCICFRLN